MFKKIVLFALLLLPMGVLAQELKIAHVNYTEIIVSMPETTEMQTQLQALQTAYEKEMEILREEYAVKYQAFMDEGESLVESIRTRRIQEIQDLEQRAETYSQQHQQESQQKQQALLAPIHQKLQDALKAVGEANNFSYIMDTSSGALVYVNPNSIDATELVKKELGLQ